ncbi:MAG: RpiB/LacA/LacB family sugar-phosphate isomerase [Candidatus Aminicenantales bacterium]|jgi:ribose 5-phosphate isomerase B
MVLPKINVAIDADDAAIELKRIIVEHLTKRGVSIADLDYLGRKKASYPEIGYNLALEIQRRKFDLGILICGTGLGMAMIANKIEGVYAGVCHDVYSAERLRKSNDAQILTMGARVIGPELAKMIVDAFVNSEFQGGGSAPKVDRLRELERRSFHK